MTKAEVLEMIGRAEAVKIGIKGDTQHVYFSISHDVARAKADEIAGYGLSVEFGDNKLIENILYIEAA